MLSLASMAETEAKRTEAHTKETANTETYDADVACSCVAYVSEHGGNIPHVDASQLRPVTDTPTVGSVVLEYFPASGLYHVALVVAVTDETITVWEANYERCKVGTRVVRRDSTRILGYIP